MTNNSPIEWFDDFIGLAYRYFEIRMTVAPCSAIERRLQNYGEKQPTGGMTIL